MKAQVFTFLIAAAAFSSCQNEEKPCLTINEQALQIREDSLAKREMDVAAREKSVTEREQMLAGNTSTTTAPVTVTEGTGTKTVAQYNANIPPNKNKEVRAAYKKPRTSTPGQFPEASERLLTEKDVQFQTVWGKKVMLNEIYARHGMSFNDATLRNHFNKESWYKGGKGRVTDKHLSTIERQNVAFIRAHQ